MKRTYIIFMLALVVCQGTWGQSKPSKKEQIAELQSLVEQQQAEISKLNSLIADVSARNAELRSQRSRLDQQAEEWRDTYRKAQSHNSSLRTQLTQAVNQINSLTEQLAQKSKLSYIDDMYSLERYAEIVGHPNFEKVAIYKKEEGWEALVDVFDHQGRHVLREQCEFGYGTMGIFSYSNENFSFSFAPKFKEMQVLTIYSSDTEYPLKSLYGE